MEASLEAVVHLPRRLKVWWCRGWDLNPRTSSGFHPSCSPMSYPRLTPRSLFSASREQRWRRYYKNNEGGSQLSG